MKFFILSALIFGCARVDRDVSLRGDASRVKITKYLPPSYCEELGEVYASHQHKTDQMENLVRNIHNKMRNKAAELGGNFVMVNSSHSGTHWGNTVLATSGTAFACRVADNRFRELRNKGLKVLGPNNRERRFLAEGVTEGDINQAVDDLRYEIPENEVVNKSAKEELVERWAE